MDVAAVIVEQLDSNGTLRTFRMQAKYPQPLIVAFAGEYDESRSGPFHFLDNGHEREFQKAFAKCDSRRLSHSKFSNKNGTYHFVSSWAGIPTKEYRLSYYALCLPEHAIPSKVVFCDPRNNREYKKSIVRDDHRQRFILYLECRSSFGTFDFSLEVDFLISSEKFAVAEFKDDTTTPCGVHVDVYENSIPWEQRLEVKNFLIGNVSMGDQYYVTGQAGAVGPNASAQGNTFTQVLQPALSSLDLPALAVELATLRRFMREHATDVEHDQAVASIGAAENAAKVQDGAKVLEHLKSAGKWAFDVATKVGADVAAKTIQIALGLP
ncbi:hypothetical protein [Pseudomonas costantinii]|uniref:Uncharacterized protein n=1 Tax=Pseudomonas costantinii TaxID=168469 RepID=A0A1S2UV11_9PSED|nr:hypothetical protein [Pseudomonas costantinii]OIN50322.1 hypothetical protein BFL40_18945 [Pseudomonas costantinii]SED84654.1 hypothetical protein SAMN04515675_2772 [Pseudomonas costantinii]